MDRELIARLHQTKEDIPENGIVIDATAPIARVVDEIVRQSEAISQSSTAVTAVRSQETFAPNTVRTWTDQICQDGRMTHDLEHPRAC